MPFAHGLSPQAIVLGIESSCDETAVAVVRADGTILANRIASQDAAHRPYGGVVPELAARAHVDALAPMVEAALADAGLGLTDLDAIAATAGPGLIGGVMVGLVTGKALAFAAGKPLIAVNHLEGHALSPRLLADVAYPYLLLLVSGGHCQLLRVAGVGRYQRLATTIDDAAGEAFDKVAKMLGLGFPGGPAVERMARDGNPQRFALPRPLVGSGSPHFSFSGLKTAVLRAHEALVAPTVQDRADLCAAFQAALVDCLVDRSRLALDAGTGLAVTPSPLPLRGGVGAAGGGPSGLRNLPTPLRPGPADAEPGLAAPPLKGRGDRRHDVTALVVAGGVAANGAIRTALEHLALTHGLPFVAPPQWLCTDNAAMIAWAGLERLGAGLVDGLDAPARARWPLDPDAPPVHGAGVKA